MYGELLCWHTLNSNKEQKVSITAVAERFFSLAKTSSPPPFCHHLPEDHVQTGMAPWTRRNRIRLRKQRSQSRRRRRLGGITAVSKQMASVRLSGWHFTDCRIRRVLRHPLSTAFLFHFAFVFFSSRRTQFHVKKTTSTHGQSWNTLS